MNVKFTAQLLIAAVAIGFLPKATHADITTIDEFTGTHTEDYDSITGVAFQELPIMNGLVTLRNLTDGGAIKIEPNSALNGDWVFPRSGIRMMGQLGILEWEFSQPIIQFGSYFENNSGTDDAVIEFFDLNDTSLGIFDVDTSASSQQWTWNGWESDDPISRMVVTGNSSTFLNGFIWYDDTQVTIASVPEPSSILMMLGAGTMFLLRRKKLQR